MPPRTPPRPRTTVLALALAACLARTAGADPIIQDVTFSTSGTVDPSTGVSGTNAVHFAGLGTTVTPSQTRLALGDLVIDPLAPGQTTTYSHTPISVTFLPQAIDGAKVSLSPLTMTGELDGAITGPYTSSLSATFRPPPSAIFADGDVQGFLRFFGGTYYLRPASTTKGHTPILGFLNLLPGAARASTPSPTPTPTPTTPTPSPTVFAHATTPTPSPLISTSTTAATTVPEPATAAVILVGLAGLGLGRRLHRAGKG